MGSAGSVAYRVKLSSFGALIALAAFAAMLWPQASQAAPPASVLGGVPCTVQGDGTTFCSDSPRSTVAAWDGVPIDVNVGLPDESEFGPGPYPLMMMFHGYGGSKIGQGGMQSWLDRGYATFSMTDRGFHESCGSVASRAAAGAACDEGYVRLIDNRYEVRDAQEFAGMLADEGLVAPKKIGSIGGSYGGGMSMALGALRNRMVMPDYSLVPWESPGGKAMEIAAATPNIPWTDLAYSLVPNGRTLDYVADAPYTGPVGVQKQSLVTGLYYSGLGAPGVYADEGTDPTADLVGWRTRLNAGEPYGADAQAIVDEITQHHSAYYIDDSVPPAPMLMSSGFTDDLFPADETIRYYNRTKTKYPDSELGLFFGDFGHPRAQNKSDVTDALDAAEEAWMDHYVLGSGPKPPARVTAYTETCPGTADSGGPYTAPSWAKIAKGEIRYDSGPAKRIEPDAGDPAIAAKFNPVGGSACATAPGADQPGVASYRLDAAPEGGYTMMGAATVIAKFTLQSNTSQVAARLLDVAPNGQETLVSRGLWRPDAGGPTEQVFQLHPNGWTFAAGHVPKLELLPADSDPGIAAGYGRPSDGQAAVTVEDLELRLPVVEKPGAQNGLVGDAAERFLPDGYELSSDVAGLRDRGPRVVRGQFKRKGAKLVGKLKCPTRFEACHDVQVVAKSRGKKSAKVAKGGRSEQAGGTRTKLKLKLTRKGRKLLRKHRSLPLTLKLDAAEMAGTTEQRGRAKAPKHGKHKHGKK